MFYVLLMVLTIPGQGTLVCSACSIQPDDLFCGYIAVMGPVRYNSVNGVYR